MQKSLILFDIGADDSYFLAAAIQPAG